MNEFSVGDVVYFPGAKFEYNQTLPYRVVSVAPFSVAYENHGPYELTAEQVAELQVSTVPPHRQEAQRYTSLVACERMAAGHCPECGEPPSAHTGWGGPHGCTLTDGGVAERIAQYQADQETQA